MRKISVSLMEGPSQQRLMRDYLLRLADLIEKGYGIGPDVRRDLAAWLRATAEGKDLRRFLGLLHKPKTDRPWWIGLDYLVRYKLTGKSEAAAREVADDWGVRSKTVIEAYSDRRDTLDNELAHQVLGASDVHMGDEKAYLEAWKLAIAHKRPSLKRKASRKKTAQIIRLESRAPRRRRA